MDERTNDKLTGRGEETGRIQEEAYSHKNHERVY
jgi:hypothetical protein